MARDFQMDDAEITPGFWWAILGDDKEKGLVQVIHTEGGLIVDCVTYFGNHGGERYHPINSFKFIGPAKV
jgi:hypothetical protein